jgi:hypothetical protein
MMRHDIYKSAKPLSSVLTYQDALNVFEKPLNPASIVPHKNGGKISFLVLVSTNLPI